MVDRGGESAEVGRQLLEYSREVFDWWHRVRDGTMARATLRTNVSILRILFRSVLSEGVECSCAKTAGTWRGVLAGGGHLWAFVRVGGGGATDNEGGGGARHGGVYRQLRGGAGRGIGERVRQLV